MGKAKSKILFVFFVLVFSVLAIGVGVALLKKPKDTKITPAGQAPVTIEPGKTELEGQLVAGFPEFPVYPGANIVSSYKKQEESKVGFEANWEADASVSEVIVWYIDALRESGWVFEEEPDDLSISEQSLVAKKDNLRVYLTVEEGVSITEINVEIPFQ